MNIKKHLKSGLRGLALALLTSVSAEAASDQQGQLEERDWHDARARDSLDAYERYLELHPLGPNAAEAFRRAMSSAPVIHSTTYAAAAATSPRTYAAAAVTSPRKAESWVGRLWRSLKNVLTFPLSMPQAKAQDGSLLDQEAREWERTLQTNTVEAFMGFLEKFPNGSFAGLASSCITDRVLCDHLQKAQPIYQ